MNIPILFGVARKEGKRKGLNDCWHIHNLSY